jgi:hypothetical protein
VGTNPTVIDAGLSAAPFGQFQVTFSKPVNPIDGSAPALYELRAAGSHGFGSPDDVVYALTPNYTPGSNVVTLVIGGLQGGTLPVGLYQFTIFSNATSSIHDLSGNALDGDANGLPGGDYVRTFTVAVGAVATTTVVTPGTASVPAGQSATFTASVSSNAGTPPDGFVQFLVNGSTYGSPVPLVGGKAQQAITEPVGSYTITAEYTGDGGTYPASPVSASSQLVVFATIDTTTALQSSEDPSKFGDAVTFTATVSPAQGSVTPTGTVQFAIDGVDFGNPVSLAHGIATLTTSSLAVGVHSVTASFTSDDGLFKTGTGTLKGGQEVDKADVTVGLAADHSTSTYGQTVTFTITVAAVMPGLPAPGGTVTIFEGSTSLGHATLNGGRATIMTSALTLGTDSIIATYGGDANFAQDSSSPFSVTVNPVLTVTSIAAVSPNPRNTLVSTLDVNFNEPINTNSLAAGGLTLTDNGGSNLITGAVTLSLVSGSIYEIDGLAGLTTAEGTYTLTVNAADIQDQSGNAGTGSQSTSWLMDTTPPTSTVSVVSPVTISTNFTVSVSSNDPAGAGGSAPSGVASIAIYAATDGGPFSYWATVTPTSPSAQFTGQVGHTYGFYGIATDNAGNVQPTPSAAQATVQVVSSVTVTSIAPVTPNPRNTAVTAISVTFSTLIDSSTINSSDVSLIDNNGSNLLTGPLSVTLITGDTYLIGGLSGLTTAEGTYMMTVNAAGIQDLFGNAGTGSQSTSWLMDTTPPTSTVDPLPQATTSTSFTVSVSGSDPAGAGDSTPSGVASITIYTATDGGNFTFWTTITPASPSAQFTGAVGHTYGFYSVATDKAGNVQPTPAAAQQTIQIVSGPVIVSIGPVAPNPRNTPVSSVDVTFSEPIDLSTFDYHDLTLTLNGGSNLITNVVTTSLVSGSTYQIGGLSGLTTAEGHYSLAVDASGIQDQYGNLGTGSMSTTWLMDTTPPTSTVDPLPATTTSTGFLVSASGTDPQGSNGSAPSGITAFAISVSDDGGPFLLFATMTPAHPSAFFTGQVGHTYGFYSVATDQAGNAQPTPAAAQQTVQVLSPLTILSIASIAPNPRNAPVAAVDVTFSEPINPTSLAAGAVTLTDNGGPNLITGAVAISLVSGSTYRVSGLAGLTQGNGNYTLTVNAAGFQDPSGNPGSGTLSASWLMDTTSPTSQVNPLPRRGTSLSFAVSVTGSDGGSPPSGVASYDLYASTNGGPWSLWTTVPASNPSATFTGQSNTTYAFYSLAHDQAGNLEVKSPRIEASTYLPDLTPPVTAVSSTSTVDNGTGAFTLNVNGTDAGGSGLADFEVWEAIDAQAPVAIGPEISAGAADTTGIIHATLTYQGLTDGVTHQYRFFSTGIDGAGNVEAAHPAPNDVIFVETFAQPASLQVTGLTVEHGAAERSYVRYLDILFNESDSQTGGALSQIGRSVGTSTPEIQLYKYDLNGDDRGNHASQYAVPLVGVNVDVIDHAIELDFGANGIGATSGSNNTTAADGYYELDVFLPSGQTAVHHFYRLLGDVTGDGVVDQNDLNAIAAAIGQSSPPGMTPLNADVNGDGLVTSLDKTLATRAKGHKLGSGLPLG